MSCTCPKCQFTLCSHSQLLFFLDVGVHLVVKYEEVDNVLPNLIKKENLSSKTKNKISHFLHCKKCFSYVGNVMTVWKPYSTISFEKNSVRLSPTHTLNQTWKDIYSQFPTITASKFLIEKKAEKKILAPKDPVQFFDVLNEPSTTIIDLIPEVKLRNYQIEVILKVFKEKTSIVCLPTGTGKTLIACVVISLMKKLNPNKKIAFVVEKVPLAFQQADAIKAYTKLQFATVVGETVYFLKNRLQSFDGYVITAQTLINLIEKEESEIESYSLFIFDEVHKCTGDHPFFKLVNSYITEAKQNQPMLLGLTASIGEDNRQRDELLENFNEAKVVIPTQFHNELKEFMIERQRIQYQEFVLSEENFKFNSLFWEYLINLPDDLTSHIFALILDKKGKHMIDSPYWLIRMNLNLKSRSSQNHLLQTLPEECRIFIEFLQTILSISALLNVAPFNIICKHLVETFKSYEAPNQQTPPFIIKKSKFYEFILQHSKIQGDKDSDKVSKLIQRIRTEKWNKAIVFVETRAAAEILMKRVQREKAFDFNINLIVGSSELAAKNPLTNEAVVGMNWEEEQSKILKAFKVPNEKSLLIATTVLQEGIDVTECDLVIDFDFDGNRSLISFIQKRGRARNVNGKYIVFTISKTELINLFEKEESMIQYIFSQVQRSNKKQMPIPIMELDLEWPSTETNSLEIIVDSIKIGNLIHGYLFIYEKFAFLEPKLFIDYSSAKIQLKFFQSNKIITFEFPFSGLQKQIIIDKKNQFFILTFLSPPFITQINKDQNICRICLDSINFETNSSLLFYIKKWSDFMDKLNFKDFNFRLYRTNITQFEEVKMKPFYQDLGLVTLNFNQTYIFKFVEANFGSVYSFQLESFYTEIKQNENSNIVNSILTLDEFEFSFNSFKQCLQYPLLKDQKENYCFIKRIVLTPSRIVCLQPILIEKNHILRSYSKNIDDFVLVSFRDENMKEIPSYIYDCSSLFNKLEKIISNGFNLGIHKLTFLGCSNSQFKSASWWFIRESSELNVQKIRKEIDSPQTLEIFSWSRPIPAYLNRKIIELLSYLGIQDAVFLNLQNQQLKDLILMLRDEKRAHKVLNLPFLNTNDFSEMMKEPFFRSLLLCVYQKQIRNIKFKSRLFVKDGKNLMGVCDDTGTLEYGQVFIRVDDQVIQSKVVVCKNSPTHPGDIRILQAVSVDKPSFNNFKNCIVFPTKGPRPHSNETAGSDLDGDFYLVIWDKDLIPDKPCEPMAYDFSNIIESRTKKDGILSLNDRTNPNPEFAKIIVGYFQHSNYKNIATALMVWQDKEDPSSEKSAREFSTKLKPKEYPSFMRKHDYPSYEFDTILGKLYNKAKDLPEEYANLKSNIEVNSDYLENGYMDYVDEMNEMYKHYAREIIALQTAFGIKTEKEIITGNILISKEEWKPINTYKIEQNVKVHFEEIRKKYKTLFDKSCENLNKQEAKKKVSAAYYVAYSFNYKKIYSFPWILGSDILISLKESKASKNLEECLPESLKTFSLQLFENYLLPNIEIREQKIEELKNTLISKGLNLDLYIFGSTFTFLFDYEFSDLDLFVLPKDDKTSINLKQMTSILKENMNCLEPTIRETENMDLLKIPQNDFNVEISHQKTNFSGPKTTLLISKYIEQNFQIHILLAYLMKWGRFSGILKHSPLENGLLSTLGFIWNFIQFCFEEKLLQPIDPEKLTIYPKEYQTYFKSFKEKLNKFYKEEFKCVNFKFLIEKLMNYFDQSSREFILVLKDPLDSSQTLYDFSNNLEIAEKIQDLILHGDLSLSINQNISYFFLQKESSIILNKRTREYLRHSEDYWCHNFAKTWDIRVSREEINEMLKIILKGNYSIIQKAISDIQKIMETVSKFPETLTHFIKGSLFLWFTGQQRKTGEVSFFPIQERGQRQPVHDMLQIFFAEYNIGKATSLSEWKNQFYYHLNEFVSSRILEINSQTMGPQGTSNNCEWDLVIYFGRQYFHIDTSKYPQSTNTRVKFSYEYVLDEIQGKEKSGICMKPTINFENLFQTENKSISLTKKTKNKKNQFITTNFSQCITFNPEAIAKLKEFLSTRGYTIDSKEIKYVVFCESYHQYSIHYSLDFNATNVYSSKKWINAILQGNSNFTNDLRMNLECLESPANPKIMENIKNLKILSPPTSPNSNLEVDINPAVKENIKQVRKVEVLTFRNPNLPQIYGMLHFNQDLSGKEENHYTFSLHVGWNAFIEPKTNKFILPQQFLSIVEILTNEALAISAFLTKSRIFKFD